MTRTPLAALVLMAALLPLGYLAGPAQAAACSGSTGVTVVVQFPDRTEIGCAPGDPASGVEALTRAGFDVIRVTKFPGAVCRIDGVPDADADPCVNMPPASAYWTYFHAQRGGTWVASNDGADGYNPRPGSVEGWRFGDGAAPSTPPPAAVATPTSSSAPKPSGSTTGQTSNPGTSSTPGAAVAAPGASAGSTPTRTATAAPSPTATSTADPSATPTETTSENGPVVEETGEDPVPASGGASWVWGVGLLAVLVAIGGAAAYRRRG